MKVFSMLRSTRGLGLFVAIIACATTLTLKAQTPPVGEIGSKLKMQICTMSHQGEVIGYGNSCVTGKSACDPNVCE